MLQYILDARSRAVALSPELSHLDATFDAVQLDLPGWMKEHYNIPLAAVVVYIVVVFGLSKVISKPLPGFRLLFGLWNLTLSLFSAFGVLFVVPDILSRAGQRGMYYSLCGDAYEFGDKGLHGVFIFLFATSKLPELLDTFFLVALKKQVMFLHWYHHITVLLYSWHGYAVANALGLWSAGMNYSVHAIMYFYFFASTLCKDTWWFKTLLAPYSKYITVIQLVQMIAGIGLLAAVAYWKYVEKSTCGISDDNITLGTVMYASYLVLFAKLYYDSYIAKTRKNAAARLAAKKTK